MVAQPIPDTHHRYGALDVVYGMPRFHYTGSLAPGDVYVERPADRLLPELLRRGTYCHILAPRQIGKSSLRVRVAERLQEEGIRCASLDLTVCGSSADPEQWYFTVAAEIADQLELPDPFGFWDQHRHITPPRRWASYLLHVLKTDPEKRRVVVFLDEIESIRLVSFPVDDFLLAIRGLFEARSTDEPLSRLTFCLIGVTTPNDLVKDKLVTPFNVSTQVRVDDFTREQLDVLGPGLADLGAPVDVLLDAVYEWTDGHPYMTMRACAALVGAGRLERVEPETVARVVREQFLERPLEDGNLGYAARRFKDTRYERQGAPVGDRIALYRRVLDGERVPADNESAAQMELRLAGMVKDVEAPDGRWLRVRNRVFATAFAREWLDGALDPWLEAQRKKIRAEETARAELGMKLRDAKQRIQASLRGLWWPHWVLWVVTILGALSGIIGVFLGLNWLALLPSAASGLVALGGSLVVRRRLREATERADELMADVEMAAAVASSVFGVAAPRRDLPSSKAPVDANR